MTINIADNSPRISYSVADGVTQTSFTVPFEFFDDEDLNVYVDGVEKTLTSDYTVSGGDGSTGTVTISVTGGSGGSTVVITRDIPLERTTDFPVSGAFNIVALNTELDRLVAVAADLNDLASRAITPLDYDPTVSYTLPTVDDRKGKTLAFNEVTGSVQAGPSIADTESVANASADIALLADIQDGTVATNAITIAANVSSDIATLGAISTDITTVSGISSNVTTVSSNDANVTTVAGISSNVTTVADNIADINTVADDLNEAVSEINTVATNITNVNTVGTNITNVNTTAGSINNVNTVASDITNVNTVSTNISNVNTVAGISANVTTVAGQTTNLQNVTDNLTAIQNAASNATSASDSATAAAASAAAAALSADTFDDTYLGSKASDPSLDNDGDALNAGDLYFNTTSNTLKVYSGSAWQDAAVDSSSFIQTSGDSMTGNLSFGDNDKAIFGAGSDLQIYHDGSKSVIHDAGTGNLLIRASNLSFANDAWSANYLTATDGAGVNIFYNNAQKLATTSTGVDITGTLTSDGLTVDGNVALNGGTSATTISADANRSGAGFQISGLLGKWNGTNAANIGIYTGSDTSNKDDGTVKIQTSEFLGTLRDRLLVASNGDISFYEDTGTTPKFFWDASDERLYIGDGTYNNDGFFLSSFGGGYQIFNTKASDIRFATNNAEAMRIDSSGNVGIGTSSPFYPLSVRNTSFATVAEFRTIDGTNNPGLEIKNSASGTTLAQVYSSGASANLMLETNNTERMRIDSSGNLLVGTTDTTPENNSAASSTSNGFVVDSNGKIKVAQYGGSCAIFNRVTTDGTIVDLRKDGSTVGSIGTYSNDVYIGNDDVGLLFNNASNYMSPHNVNTNSPSDGAMDIGAGSRRFKDLYLSGGVYLGGTGAANKLDDYEEGTWTPVYEAETGSFTTMTYSNNTGHYTKVGRLVTVQLNMFTSNVNLTGASGYLKISGLPFTVATDNHAGAVTGMYRWNFATDRTAPVQLSSIATQTYCLMYKPNVNSSTPDPVQVTDLLTGASGFRNAVIATISYITT